MKPNETPEQQWDGILRRTLDVTVKAADAEGRWVDVVASTAALDSHGDIVEQDWNLERYAKNPVILWNHNNFGSWKYSEGTNAPADFLPIGHATNVRVEDGELQVRIMFGSKEFNPLSEQVFLGYKEGHLNAVSVGFAPGRITEEVVDGKTRFRLGNNELMEISCVTIPSNPEAVAKSIDLEHENLGRLAVSNPASSQEHLSMTPEEKAAYDAAIKDAADLRAKSVQADTDLKAEKAASAQLETDRDAHKERADKAEEKAKKADHAVIESEIKKLVGKKLTPAEGEDQIVLAKEIGLERVMKMIEKRSDLALTQTVKDGDGNPLKDTSDAESASDDNATGGSQSIVDTAHKAIS